MRLGFSADCADDLGDRLAAFSELPFLDAAMIEAGQRPRERVEADPPITDASAAARLAGSAAGLAEAPAWEPVRLTSSLTAAPQALLASVHEGLRQALDRWR
jgi:hypothetical protein